MAVLNRSLPEMQRQIGCLDDCEDEYSDHEGNLLDLVEREEQHRLWGKKVLKLEEWNSFVEEFKKCADDYERLEAKYLRLRMKHKNVISKRSSLTEEKKQELF